MDDSNRPDTSETGDAPRTSEASEPSEVSETASSAGEDTGTVTVTVRHGDDETTLTAPRGVNLRRFLLEHGFSPYTAVTERLNCGGRGLCATCGVRLDDPPEPTHWHDRIAARFGYPRLSCQITVDAETTVELVEDKRIWGGRE